MAFCGTTSVVNENSRTRTKGDKRDERRRRRRRSVEQKGKAWIKRKKEKKETKGRDVKIVYQTGLSRAPRYFHEENDS